MKKLIGLIAIILAFAIVADAQPTSRKLNAAKKLKIADEQYAKGDYYNALEWYNKVLEGDNEDLGVMHKVAELHYLLRDFENAETWYTKVLKKDKSGQFANSVFTLGKTLKMNGKLDAAQQKFEKFIQESDDNRLKQLAAAELSGIELAREMEADEDITVTDAGDNVNSPFTDFSPVYGPDGTMYYGAMVSDEVIVLDGKSDKDYFAKIYTSNKTGDRWSKGTALSEVINRPGSHTGNVTFSADGQRMYFTRAELSSNQLSSSAVYVSERSGNEWGPAAQIDGIGGSYIVKQPAVGEMFGEEVLFFTSDMSGGQGGWDIYYSKINGDDYASPVNLGKAINTPGNDVTPSYRDGTLYFSSNGHPGIGGLDAFASAWKGSWSTPENLGKDINSSYDDIYFSLDETGYKGFVVSNRPSSRSLKSQTCCDDIYTVDIKEVVLDLEALTMDSKTREAINGATVQLVVMTDDGVKGGNTETDSKASDHKYGFGLSRETAYKIIASKEGYKDVIIEFNTVGLNETQTLSKTLNLVPIEPVIEEVIVYDTIRSQTPIRLDNILYDFDKSDIRGDAEIDLNQILTYMTSYPDMVIELSSHTDAKGREAYNQQLSQKRANSAKSWLVGKGITDNRIQAVGYGESQPVAPNKLDDGTDNPEGRQLNRRTEFKIIGGTRFIVNQRIEKRVVKKTVGE